jgi:catechol 2,3-dioxygenase-like lactoylglutathione lyase family enzyme
VLADADMTTLVSVKDLDEAAAFYEKTLGLTKVREDPGFVLFRTGTNDLIVYASEFAGSNKATNAAWHVDDLEETVRELGAKGVTFEHYDNLPGTRRDGDIHDAGGFKIAWFRDPTGNILEINNGLPS